MPAGFPDHFSDHAADYARYRPGYPAALFEHLAGLSPGRSLAWDCATGNGQAARALAQHFERVIATDASPRQIESATAHPRVTYRVARAEDSGLRDGSVELVAVAQALHWFDRARFWAEARRVLVAGGVLAAWCYDELRVEPRVDAALRRLYGEIVGPFWPAERALVERGYGALEFPFDEIPSPAFEMRERWDLARLMGYLDTWSATRRYRESLGSDPLLLVRPELEAAWGAPETVRNVSWRLDLRAGRRADCA